MKLTIRQGIAICLISILVLSITGCEKTAEDGNAETSTVIDGTLSFSAAGGLYTESFGLILSTDIENGIIRYTLDGSDPTMDSDQYTDEIAIEDRTSEDNLLSAIVISGGSGEDGFGGAMPDGAPPDGDMTPPEAAEDGDTDVAAGDIQERTNMDNNNRGGGMGAGSTQCH